MNKSIKIFLLVLGIIIALMLAFFTFILIITSGVKLEKDKLINMERIVTYYDINGNKFAEEVGGISVTESKKIPTHVKNAFVAIEDKRFYSHKGVDYRRLLKATFNNIKSFSFKEGASTITQQLIKNTHLSSKKTLKRKLSEIKLARELEKNYTKDEILEKYINTIYFGNGCYGITSASKFYFNKAPNDLTINEGAILASIIKAPTHYSPISNVERCTKRKNLVLLEMKEQGYINNAEYNLYRNTPIKIESHQQYENNFLSLARGEFDNFIKKYPYVYNNFSVYTSFDPNIQNILEKEKLNNDDYQNASIVINKENNIVAYTSSCPLNLRQPGSTIKPLLVYAPAIELNTVYSCSPILDEKTDFNGYNPSNFNDKYYGYVSVKESLAKSLNTCAVKLLNYVGVENAKNFIEKTNIKFEENDNSLCLALGSMSKGVNLIDLTSSYNVLLNSGNYKSCSCVQKILTNKTNVVYENKSENQQVFSAETIDIVNDMLSYTVTDGTAKKLSTLPFPIYAKTGTVGNKNGNSDAYTISYTADYILTTWCGSDQNDKLMSNNVTGGNQPTKQAFNIWSDIYKNNIPNSIQQSNKICYEYIDLISYNNDHTVKIADKNAPMRYKEYAIFKKNYVPKEQSTTFSLPKIEKPIISVKNKQIKLSLCLTQYCEAIIFKHFSNKKVAVFDTATTNTNTFIDNDVEIGKKYQYSIIPYTIINNEKIYGEEIYLDTIKITSNLSNDWWKNELD